MSGKIVYGIICCGQANIPRSRDIHNTGEPKVCKGLKLNLSSAVRYSPDRQTEGLQKTLQIHFRLLKSVMVININLRETIKEQWDSEEEAFSKIKV